MSLQSCNSKKYSLAVFLSISLLSISFLSWEARASSFKDLATKVPELKKLPEVQQVNTWCKDYNLQKKQEIWKSAKLVPSINQAILDVGNGYNPKDLSAKFPITRYNARQKKAEVDLYIAGIEKPNFYTTINGYIQQNKIPTFEEAALNLAKLTLCYFKCD